MARVILQNGLVDVGDGNFERTDLAIDDGRIAAIGNDADAGAGGEVVDCGRFAIVPGMVNAHCHSNENWFRGRWDNLPLEPWMLFSYPALAAPVQSSREIYVRTLIGGLEHGPLRRDLRGRLPLRDGGVHARSRWPRSCPPTAISGCAR